jgi:HEAT repeat protein/lysophospholipase L1-like esterase
LGAPTGRGAELASNLALSLASVALVLGGAELAVRRFAHETAVAAYITDWQDWEGEFYTVKSTAAGWPPWEDYNGDGLRDRDHEVARTPGTRRVVCLGDSTTLGWGVSPPEAYPQVLEEMLEAEGDRTEVLNVALGGWSTRQELIAYRRIARKYRPDVVLLGICLNDVAEMEDNLSRPPRWLAALYRRSALVRRLVRAREREIADVEQLFSERDSPGVRAGYARVFADLLALRDEVKADGAAFAVLIFPFRFQTLPDAPPPSAQETIAAFCKAEGIPYLDLLPAIRRAGPESFHDIDHFSVAGAHLVASEVLASGLVGTTSSPLTAPQEIEPRVADVPALIGTLAHVDDHERVTAARALARLGPAAHGAAPALASLLADGSPVVRATAARALGAIGPLPTNTQLALVARLGDADERVRWRATESLEETELDPTVCLEPLTRILTDRRSPGHPSAARVLGTLGPEAAPAVPALVMALDDPSPPVRARAAWALGRIGAPARGAVSALVKAMGDPEVRWWAIDALGGLGPDAAPALPAVVAALHDPSSNVRWRASLALASIGPAARAAAPALVEVARDDQENVRLGALAALAKVDAAVDIALPVYRRALDDPAPRVRDLAAKDLGLLGPAAAPAAEELAAHLTDEDVGVRARAARSLGRLGRLPRSVRRALERAAQDREEVVRVEAAKALTTVRP